MVTTDQATYVTYKIPSEIRTYLGMSATRRIKATKYGEVIIPRLTNGLLIKSQDLVANDLIFQDILAIINIREHVYNVNFDSINYLPLASNYVKHLHIYITDFTGNPLAFDDRQAFVVLHFK